MEKVNPIDCNLEEKINKAIETAKKSKEETKVGAVVYSENGELLTASYNIMIERFVPEGVVVTNENRHEYIKHAEDYALYLTDLFTLNPMNGTIVIAGKCPCMGCAEKIVQYGIKRVLCPEPDKNSKWVKSNSSAIDYLESNGVTVIFIDELKGLEEGLTCPSRYQQPETN